MTRDEFVSLPLRIALGILYDRAQAWLVTVPRPDVPKPPLFDGRLSKSGGFVWMSEMTLDDLQWWANAKQKSAEDPERSEYRERNEKALATLQKWIAWRVLYPSERWSGKRGEERVTAEPPGRNPTVNEWGPRNDAKKPNTSSARGTAPANAPADDEPEGYGF